MKLVAVTASELEDTWRLVHESLLSQPLRQELILSTIVQTFYQKFRNALGI